MHYGYIGLGNLGEACAGCLVKAGFKVTVYDLNPKLAEPLVAMGATLAKSAEDLAGAVDHVITCLPSPAVSERVLRNILPRMKKGASWVEMSTLGRDEVLTLAAVAAEAGVRMEHAARLVQYFRDLRHYPHYNRVRGLFFEAPVVSTVVEVSRMLPDDRVLVEVEATFWKPANGG